MPSAKRLLSWTLVLAGVAIGAWTVAVWQWQDPVTALYTAHRQSQLRGELQRRTEAFVATQPEIRQPATATQEPLSPEALRRFADSFAAQSRAGAPLGTLVVPRIGLSTTVVNGTAERDLRSGPGRQTETGMPGQHRLVYIAGHRTTYGAPFANIDRLEPGDTIRFELPYAVFTYRVTRTRIVDAHDLSVLQPGTKELIVLQACHPRFFATQRLLVYAVPDRVVRPKPV